MAVGLTLKPLSVPGPSSVDFGVEIQDVDIEKLSDADFDDIRKALYHNHIVVIRGQAGLCPKAQYEFTRRFDPASSNYGHGKTLDATRSVLHPDLKVVQTIPHQPQVQVIGNGFIESYEGLENVTLKHPHHKKFHKTAIPDSDDLDFTRFFRWHIDAALYDLNPPKVTSLMAVKVPQGRHRTVRYDDGSGDEMSVPLGTTAFVSGYRMYDLLSEEDKKLAVSAKIEYAAHPYIWMSSAASRSTGLGLITEGLELPVSALPSIEESKIKILPMCWKNPVTGKLALQIHPSAVKSIQLEDVTVLENLEEVREIVYPYAAASNCP